MLLLIGEAPGRGGSAETPLTGRIGRRLAKVAGVSFEDYLKATERTNLLQSWPGPAGKGSLFPSEEAADAAEAMLPKLTGRVVLLLGWRVAEAFGMEHLDYLQWDTMDTLDFENPLSSARIAIIPHPSGVNRWYNDPKNVRKMRDFLRPYLMRSELT